jgi:hypothetical protein
MQREKFILFFIFFSILLTGCNKQIESIKKDLIDRNTNDLVMVGDKKINIGYYKSSILKIDDVVQVWLHLPGADKNSKNELGKMSDFLVEISCKSHKLRIMKFTDTEGNKLLNQVEDEWNSPSPADDFYQVILKVCEEVVTQ